MNKDLAIFVLNGLVERASVDRKATFVSEAELLAIRVLIGHDVGGQVSVEGTTAGPEEPTPAKFRPKVKWQSEMPSENETRICLDFGTSFSKAFACDGDDPLETPELIDIALTQEEEGSARYLLPSELIVHEEKVYFGRSARRIFDDIAAEQERLIDNPKQFMTLSRDVSNLVKRSLSVVKDPERLFSERDALVLFLSHLIRMVDLSLEVSGLSNSLPTRYTHPAWKKEFAADNAQAMKRIVAEAMALARSYPADFERELETNRASSLLVAARTANVDDLPFELLEEPVLEATAAGAGALMDSRPNGRQHYVILDIGAGTTDVAGCLCVKVDEDHVNVWEIQSARGAKNQAGNVIDNALQKFILENSSLAKGSPEYEQSERALRKSIRSEKEILFNEGELNVDLVTDESVEVRLDDFIREPTVKRIFDTIKDMVIRAAFAVKEGDSKVFLVPTGGGANLPVVSELVADPLEEGDRRVKLELRNAMPELLQEAYPAIEPFYPQLAVAIGGAHPALPEQKPSLDQFKGDPGKKTLAPVYRS